MIHLVHVSAGLTSDEALRRVIGRYGTKEVRPVFADTLTEDEDAYRFLIESTAEAMGCLTPAVRRLAQSALDLPPATEATIDARRKALARLRFYALRAIPHMVWLMDGRWIWEVFRDERYIGNSRTCPAAKRLKFDQLDGYRAKYYRVRDVVVYLGLDWTEMHRVDRARERNAPWRTDFPLLDEPLVWKDALDLASRNRGIDPPRLYALGFAHNNCAGRCCKKGQAAAELLLRHFPDRYAEDERLEDRLGADLGGYTMMREQVGGKKRSLSLKVLRQRIESQGAFDFSDWGVCGCDVDIAEESEAA